MLRFFFFGAPRIERDGQVIPMRRTKALALLAYLALNQHPHDRETLIGLLWPEFDEDSARNNLRRELSLLRAALDQSQDILAADRSRIAWSPTADVWVDISAFNEEVAAWRRHEHPPGELCATCADGLSRAAALYVDDFMAGFTLPDSPAFDEWQFFQREGLRQQLGDMLHSLAGWHSARQEHRAAIEHARRRAALDPLHEPAQRDLMRLYAWSGQQAAALRQYEVFARLLDAELGAEPEPETTRLCEDIKAGRVGAPAPEVLPEALPAPKPRRRKAPALPLPASDFVGRRHELSDIIRRLTDPACRLLTISGPGGMGKTRLALRVAEIMAQEGADDELLADGVFFVPLAAVSCSSGVAPALAAAFQIDFAPGLPPERQVLDGLRDKRALIVLDNFEHMLGEAAFVERLLAAAPGLRLLVTSREALSLQEEWFHPIGGLSFPQADDESVDVAQLAHYDAVRLFEQHARRVRGDFSLSRERAAVVSLCRLVEGMPLALELAASWLKVLSVEQVVAAIARDLDVLTARDRNIPERHRSMRAVLEESWSMMPAEQQQTFARLAVFAGGFSAEAAEAVAGASLATLATLVEKSLVRSGPDGRFQLHELLRQYAEERLRQSPGESAAAERAHTLFFAALAERAEAELRGPQQQAWVERLAADLENLRAALSRSRAAGDAAALLRLCCGLWQFWNIRGRRSEGRAWLEAALAQSALGPADGALAALRAQAERGAGTLALNQGDYEAAQAHYAASLAAFEQLDDIQGREIALSNCGLVALYRGDLATARALFERSLALSAQSGSNWNLSAVTHNLALVLAQQGDFAAARPLFAQSLELSRAIGDQLGILISLVDYAGALASYGDTAAAEPLAREALALSRETANAQLTSDALSLLGLIALLEGDDAQARPLLEEAVAQSELVDDGKSVPVEALVYLGMACLRGADQAAARAHLLAALEGDRAAPNSARRAAVMRGLACAAAAAGDSHRAAQLFGACEALSRALGHAPTPAERALARPYVQMARAALGERSFAAAWAAGEELSLEAAYELAPDLGRPPSGGVPLLLPAAAAPRGWRHTATMPALLAATVPVVAQTPPPFARAYRPARRVRAELRPRRHS